MPDAFVRAVLMPPAKVALAPVCTGAAKVTVTFGTGFPAASVTSAASGLGNTVAIAVVCPLPLATAIFAAGPGVLVSEKMADVAVPDPATTLKLPLMLFAVMTAEVARP